MTHRNRLVFVAIVCTAWPLSSCARTAPDKPLGVPEAAVWAGGPDGGVWALCNVDPLRQINPCAVYADVTGKLIVADDYVVESTGRAAAREDLDIVFADGQVMHLKQGGLKLVRLRGPR